MASEYKSSLIDRNDITSIDTQGEALTKPMYSSASDLAWTMILGKTCSDPDGFQQLYAEDHELDNMNFNIIHKIVLELVSRDLDDELELSTAFINVVDSKGRTPLSWAVQRGDHDSALKLLEHGANPNVFDRTGRSLYRWAVLPSSPACVRLLIQYGAKINHPDVYGNTPLHWACWFQEFPDHAEALVNAGADFTFRSYEGNKPTPLHLAFWHGRDKVATILLKAGAVIPKEEVNSFVMIAVQEKMVKTIRYLSKSLCAADLSPDAEGNNVLHAAALSDLETLDVLKALPLVNLDASAKNNDELSAFDLLDMREDTTVEFGEAFVALVESLVTNLPSEAQV